MQGKFAMTVVHKTSPRDIFHLQDSYDIEDALSYIEGFEVEMNRMKDLILELWVMSGEEVSDPLSAHLDEAMERLGIDQDRSKMLRKSYMKLLRNV